MYGDVYGYVVRGWRKPRKNSGLSCGKVADIALRCYNQSVSLCVPFAARCFKLAVALRITHREKQRSLCYSC